MGALHQGFLNLSSMANPPNKTKTMDHGVEPAITVNRSSNHIQAKDSPNFIRQLDVYDHLEEIHHHVDTVFKIAKHSLEHGQQQIEHASTLRPDAQFKIAWDMVMLCSILYCAIIVPYDIAVT